MIVGHGHFELTRIPESFSSGTEQAATVPDGVALSFSQALQFAALVVCRVPQMEIIP